MIDERLLDAKAISQAEYEKAAEALDAAKRRLAEWR